MKHLIDYDKSPIKNADGLIAVVRMGVGIILLWKAMQFFLNQSAFLQQFESIGNMWFAPVIWAHLVILTHFFGGLCLLMGIGTRIAAILQIPILLGAVFMVHFSSLSSMTNLAEANLAIVTLLLLGFYAIRGSGTHSLDYRSILKEEAHLDEHHIHHA